MIQTFGINFDSSDPSLSVAAFALNAVAAATAAGAAPGSTASVVDGKGGTGVQLPLARTINIASLELKQKLRKDAKKGIFERYKIYA